ncbi:ABC transporter ATP-binding protein [Pseudorhodoferax sp. Leaf265]|uniref:ABC transporter ATP-binding protein n=1 Tax=Pseudorhodoferax sp. Leaf265 TaxID=1736315 RepID=UPI0006FDE6FE|nr:ABC transporter ATP-binding protein [Pseudorhodoferax sp. Leaf265]KQP03825.1 ABC transporter ATP-binding protein [Pseudorhodoferax sp. Leaf265]
MLEITQLVKRFGGLVATDHADLQVQAGEIHALIGPNGAGKTTLLHQISGALASDSGSIRFEGANITRRPMHERVAAGLARSYQITNIYRSFSVLDNVALAVQARSGTSLSFFRAVRRETALFDQTHEVLRRVGLAHRADALARNIAHGEQRQLELALALATQPRLLVLDEPMAGMGPDESAAMTDLLESLRGSITMLLVEHDMHAVFRLADRISVLVYGSVIDTGSPEAIRNSPEVRKAYLGEEETA